MRSDFYTHGTMGQVSSINDIQLFIDGMLDHQVITSDTFDLMVQVHSPDLFANSGPDILSSYGYGVQLDSNNPQAFGHGEGWDGFRTFILIRMNTNIHVSILTNGGDDTEAHSTAIGDLIDRFMLNRRAKMFKLFVTFILLNSVMLLTSCAGTDQFVQASSKPVELKEFVGIYQPFAHAGFYVEISENNGELYVQGKNQDKAVLVRDSEISFHIPNQLRIFFKLSKLGPIEEFLLEQKGAEYLYTKREVLLSKRTKQTEFQNSYDSVFKGNGPHSKYDKIDYLTENEKAYKSYTIVSRGSDDIDRTLGYDYHNFMVAPDFKALQSNDEPSITWLGHASFLVKMADGSSFLTDPVFDEFDGVIGSLSHFLFDEFERVSPSVVNEQDVDFVDAVLISHNHYDHLSLSTIENLGNNISYFVPLNIGDEFPSDFQSVFEMDWYTTNILNQNLVHFVPAHHYSGRGIFDDNESLWGGWVIESKGQKIYFSGDTGYSPIFKDIAEKYGDMDICLMAIAAYAYDGRDIHMAPEDALKAADELGCKTFIPWGYGTWATGYEHVLEPLRRLRDAMSDNNYNFELKVLKMGETYDIAPKN